MDLSQSPWYVLQFHQEADSPYLYKFAQDQWFLFDAQNLLKIEIGKQIALLYFSPNPKISKRLSYRVVQQDFTPEIEVFLKQHFRILQLLV